MKTLVILAGGASSRMKKSQASAGLSAAEVAAANVSAKCLIVLQGDKRPVLDYIIKNAQAAYYSEIILITSPQNDSFKSWYGDNTWNKERLGVTIKFAIQHIPEGRKKPYGTADALQQAMDQYPELKEKEFVVCNSDNLYSADALNQLQITAARNAFIAYDRSGLDFPEEKIARFALCRLNKRNELIDIIEKPKLEELENYRDKTGTLRVSMNIFKFNGADLYWWLVDCPENPERKEKELPTAIWLMIRNMFNASMLGIPLKEHVPDLTTKEDIAIFRSQLK
ncbi:sugar phosphate nucleotidyltransferase [Gilvibacter sp.]|uniref:sugar phosphate nucleotidyltransferase n=1 Tax=Gilvibacter sp. TaxID=2729997 RepID=UPI0025B94993|nr:sugar phosphate nucleotidyltransferase [Gilvibacter sp.]